MVRGVNPDAITDLINRFGVRDVRLSTSLTRYQLLELLEESTSKRSLFQYDEAKSYPETMVQISNRNKARRIPVEGAG